MSLTAQNFAVAPALRGHVEALASEEMEGRRAGSDGERAAARYLYDALRDAGVLMLTDSLGQDFRISGEQGEIASQNIVGIVEGADPQLRAEYIVVGARYDHLGTHELTVDGEPVVQLYPGADANASGVAVLVELARMVSQYRGLFRRSILFVGFGAGEEGMAGAWYFVNRAFDPLSYLLDKTREQPVVTLPVFTAEPPISSDYLPFYERQIPVFLFTTGPVREHRTIKDTPWRLDYSAMEASCNYLYHFLLVLAAQDAIVSEDDPAVRASRGERVYAASDCDVRPQFFHSDERHFLRNWVYKYLKYPLSAIEQNVQGQVLVSFIVEQDGSVTDVRVEHGIDERLDDEAVRVVSVSPKWIPGQIKGRKVRTRIVIPVEFRLKK